MSRSVIHAPTPSLLLVASCIASAIAEPPTASRPTASSRDSRPLVAAARRLTLEGYYERAAAALDEAATLASDDLSISLARVELDERAGRYRDGLGRLRAASKQGESSADWHAWYAALSIEVGDYEAAVEHAKAALRIQPAHYRARYDLGRACEILGRIDEAIAAYKWFDDTMKRRLPDSAEDLTWLGRGFIRYSLLVRHPDIVARLQHALREVFQEAVEFVDAKYWPAWLAIADLELDTHKRKDAEDDFAKVRQINSKAFEADVRLAQSALEDWNFELIEQRVRAALEINPNSVAAQVVLGQSRMLERRYADAAECATRALQVNPRSLEALSLQAAALLRDGKVVASDETRAKILAINPRPAILYHTLGVWLSAARQYEDSETAFKKAIECAPWWSEPPTELGLMYMQSGNETGARTTLESAHALFPYNVMAFNVLELLDELDAYARHETPHFVIRYDREQDAVLIPWLAEHLEAIYSETCNKFAVTLPRKTTIEVFPRHGNFSVRITGRPWIHTVGACTGPVIAMDAPRSGAAPQPFNWAEVLRHEFTHTVTLAATENRIPHWMTEGLAVHQESRPRTWTTCEALSEAVRTGHLFTMDTIDWGFMRPRRANDRSLAYAQSEWMIEFIENRWGRKAVLDLLKAYLSREPQPAAFRQVLKLDPERFITEFKTWAAKQVDSWGLASKPIPEIPRLKAAAAVSPKDADAQAALAEAAWYDGDVETAESAARAAVKAKRDHLLGGVILGRLLTLKAEHLTRAGKEGDAGDALDEAHRVLRRVIKSDPRNAVALKCLARVQQVWKQWDESAALWSRYREVCPQDPESYRSLAGIHLRNGERDKARPLLESAWRLDPADADVARQAGECYLEMGRPSEAADWFLRAVQVNAYDTEIYLRLGDAAQSAKRPDLARRAFESVCTLSPEAADGYERLAALARQRGDMTAAAEFEKQAEQRKGNQRGAEKPVP